MGWGLTWVLLALGVILQDRFVRCLVLAFLRPSSSASFCISQQWGGSRSFKQRETRRQEGEYSLHQPQVTGAGEGGPLQPLPVPSPEAEDVLPGWSSPIVRSRSGFRTVWWVTRRSTSIGKLVGSSQWSPRDPSFGLSSCEELLTFPKWRENFLLLLRATRHGLFSHVLLYLGLSPCSQQRLLDSGCRLAQLELHTSICCKRSAALLYKQR